MIHTYLHIIDNLDAARTVLVWENLLESAYYLRIVYEDEDNVDEGEEPLKSLEKDTIELQK